eukprot:2575703-Pleurochrysis_carterae.AAC.3
MKCSKRRDQVLTTRLDGTQEEPDVRVALLSIKVLCLPRMPPSQTRGCAAFLSRTRLALALRGKGGPLFPRRLCRFRTKAGEARAGRWVWSDAHCRLDRPLRGTCLERLGLAAGAKRSR